MSEEVQALVIDNGSGMLWWITTKKVEDTPICTLLY
jgi:hypothetical protein